MAFDLPLELALADPQPLHASHVLEAGAELARERHGAVDADLRVADLAELALCTQRMANASLVSTELESTARINGNLLRSFCRNIALFLPG